VEIGMFVAKPKEANVFTCRGWCDVCGDWRKLLNGDIHLENDSIKVFNMFSHQFFPRNSVVSNGFSLLVPSMKIILIKPNWERSQTSLDSWCRRHVLWNWLGL